MGRLKRLAGYLPWDSSTNGLGTQERQALVSAETSKSHRFLRFRMLDELLLDETAAMIFHHQHGDAESHRASG